MAAQQKFYVDLLMNSTNKVIFDTELDEALVPSKYIGSGGASVLNIKSTEETGYIQLYAGYDASPGGGAIVFYIDGGTASLTFNKAAVSPVTGYDLGRLDAPFDQLWASGVNLVNFNATPNPDEWNYIKFIAPVLNDSYQLTFPLDTDVPSAGDALVIKQVIGSFDYSLEWVPLGTPHAAVTLDASLNTAFTLTGQLLDINNAGSPGFILTTTAANVAGWFDGNPTNGQVLTWTTGGVLDWTTISLGTDVTIDTTIDDIMTIDIAGTQKIAAPAGIAKGDIIYSNSAGNWNVKTIGDANDILYVNTDVPAWGSFTTLKLPQIYTATFNDSTDWAGSAGDYTRTIAAGTHLLDVNEKYGFQTQVYDDDGTYYNLSGLQVSVTKANGDVVIHSATKFAGYVVITKANPA